MKNNHYRRNLVLITLAVILAISTAGYFLFSYLSTHNMPILQPKGSVGQSQLDLLIFTGILSLLVIIPVFSIAIFIAFKYNANNQKSKYTPDWDNNHTIEFIWWGIPILLIAIVAVVTWISTHKLNPYKALDENRPSMVIEVVSLDWKWLFIYPDQDIATVNYVKFPINTQIDFTLTADGPMNSFWIPQLGGQMYTMQGMVTHQHLDAYQVGDFSGSSANISGEGFAGMKFTASAMTKQDFSAWVNSVKSTKDERLNSQSYDKLARPSKNHPKAAYSSVDKNLFNDIVHKYMGEVESQHEKILRQESQESKSNQSTKPDHSTSDHSKMDHSNMEME